MTFDGIGRYSLNAQQTVGTLNATPLAGSGTYSIGSSGTMTIGNPQRNSLTINARLGTEAIVGSTTESGDNTFDFFIAVPAATPTQAVLACLPGRSPPPPWNSLWVSPANVRSAFFHLAARPRECVPPDQWHGPRAQRQQRRGSSVHLNRRTVWLSMPTAQSLGESRDRSEILSAASRPSWFPPARNIIILAGSTYHREHTIFWSA